MPNSQGMQDWEYEVADPERVLEFLAAYDIEDLSDDERFCLMEIVIQSFEELEDERLRKGVWPQIEAILRQNFGLHAHTVWYWACFENPLEDYWSVTPQMRLIYQQECSAS